MSKTIARVSILEHSDGPYDANGALTGNETIQNVFVEYELCDPALDERQIRTVSNILCQSFELDFIAGETIEDRRTRAIAKIKSDEEI